MDLEFLYIDRTLVQVEGVANQIIRDNTVIIDISVEINKLTLFFKFEEDVYGSGGRIQTVVSNYVFVLSK